jgi:hypothetical protein
MLYGVWGDTLAAPQSRERSLSSLAWDRALTGSGGLVYTIQGIKGMRAGRPGALMVYRVALGIEADYPEALKSSFRSLLGINQVNPSLSPYDTHCRSRPKT